jgi:hypothetical protein
MDELVEHWTVLDDELELVAGKRGATRLGFTLLLKYYTRHGRFPRGPVEFADEVVGYVARQVKVPASDLGRMTGPAGRSSTTAPRSAITWGFGCAAWSTRRS